VNHTDTIVVIGGSSGIGLAVAGRALADGHAVVIVGRSRPRLDEALAALGSSPRLEAVQADVGRRADLAALFHRVGSLRHLVVTAADIAYGPFRSLTDDDLMRTMRSKLLGPIVAAQEAAGRMPEGGSITFTSGIAVRRPMPGGSLAAAANGGLESLARALALELAPVRVNAVSPGWVDTPIWDRIATADARRARLAEMAARLPTRRLTQAAEVADAVVFLMRNEAVTGTVLHAEAGQALV
jgi:NAD(P)-dependent dehydrogenase (short-subunit alcohol dehydrogenase family)